jgi:P2-related tail formation protein
VLARFHPLLTITEWWETTPRRTPHTFEVRAPSGISAAFLTAETANAIIRDVAAAKPLRSHFDFVQTLEAQAFAWIANAGIAGTHRRADYSAIHDTSLDWANLLQTEDGEPIFDVDGGTLETA